jgi:predicted MPP superfamily phosphohydrolase
MDAHQALRLTVFFLLVCASIVFALVGTLDLVGQALGLRALKLRQKRVAFAGTLVALVGAACAVEGFLVEPDWVEVTFHELRTPKLATGTRLRIVQVSDLHISRMTHSLAALPAEVNALHPDLFFFTGDSVESEAGLPVLRSTLSAIQSRYGRYAVQGNHDTDVWTGLNFFGGGVAEELHGDVVTAADGRLTLCGAAWGQRLRVNDCLKSSRDAKALRVVAYHTPDLVEALEPLGVDLYLAGHTHGGQVRLPFYGAIVTQSDFDKKYEAGLYSVGSTTLYVNRGFGTVDLPVRFLCRPEITVIDLVGTG